MVTGGAGFIGSNLVEKLVQEGFTVRILDNFSTGRKENIADFLKEVELLEGDISDKKTAYQAVRGSKYIFHQAALGSVPRSIEDPVSTHKSNIDGTLNLLLAARDEGVKRVVVAGSSSVYGANPSLPKDETQFIEPLSPYAVTKACQEMYARAFYYSYGLETVTLRYFNVYGPRQNPHSAYAAVIPKFISALLRGEQPIIYGDGEQSRDFTFVGDVVDANLAAIEAKDVAGKVFNISGGKQTTLKELLNIIGRLCGVNPIPKFAPPRKGDVKHSFAVCFRAHEQMGWHARVPLEEGLKMTIAYFRRELNLF